MLPARFQPFIFGLIVSGFMSCFVSGIATFRAVGMIEGFFGVWMMSWLNSWAVAYPIILLVSPMARRLTQRLVRAE